MDVYGLSMLLAFLWQCPCEDYVQAHAQVNPVLPQWWEGGSSKCDNLLKAVTLNKNTSLATEGDSFIMMHARR